MALEPASRRAQHDPIKNLVDILVLMHLDLMLGPIGLLQRYWVIRRVSYNDRTQLAANLLPQYLVTAETLAAATQSMAWTSWVGAGGLRRPASWVGGKK